MRHVLLVLALALTGCSGFRTLERGDWVLAYTDEVVQTQNVNGTNIEVVKPAPGSRQEVIPLDRYEAEITEGKRRKVSTTFASTPKDVAQISEPLEMMLGEVRELRVSEPQEVTVSLAGDAVKAFWGRRVTNEEWKDGSAIEHKESSLFLQADDAGRAKVKVEQPGKEPLTVEVSVHAR